jgi:hypothetical protein
MYDDKNVNLEGFLRAFPAISENVGQFSDYRIPKTRLSTPLSLPTMENRTNSVIVRHTKTSLHWKTANRKINRDTCGVIFAIILVDNRIHSTGAYLFLLLL